MFLTHSVYFAKVGTGESRGCVSLMSQAFVELSAMVPLLIITKITLIEKDNVTMIKATDKHAFDS